MSSEISTDASLMDMDAPLPTPSEVNCLMRRGCYIMLHIGTGLSSQTAEWEQNSGPQFKGRVRLLADEFGLQLSGDEISKAWKLRSKLVHADGFLHNLETILPKSEHSGLYEKMEGLLRMAVRRCLLDTSFGDCFRDDAAVRARWPI
jgi:hypothetical protein